MQIRPWGESPLLLRFQERYKKHGDIHLKEKPFSSGMLRGLHLRVRHSPNGGLLGHMLILIEDRPEGRVVQILSVSGQAKTRLRAAKRGENVRIPYDLCRATQGTPPSDPLAPLGVYTYRWFENPAFD